MEKKDSSGTSNTTSPSKIVIIGGGFSGLAAAALLSKKGWQVTVLEKNKTLGGRARVLKKKGFSFDMGPSWYMMPEVFEKFFAEFDKKTSDFYELVRLDPRYQVIFSDGERAILTDDFKQNLAWFEKQEQGAGKKLRQFLQKMESIYNLATTGLMYEDIWSVRAWVKKENLWAFWRVATKLKLWRSWHQEVFHFFQSEKLQQVLGFPAVFLGGSPFNTPALYSILAWADFGAGVWYPQGGMIKVVEALEQLALKQGATIRTNTEATAILVENGQVQGVRAGTQVFPADIVIGATDLPHLESQLLPAEYQKKSIQKWNKKTLGISALLLYIGLNKKIPQVLHHNIYFSKNWQQNFKEIFEEKKLPGDPSLYISIRSATDESIVPKNSEEIVVLVPLASAEYSKSELSTFTQKIMTRLEDVLQFPVKKHIVIQEVFTPTDFATEYNAYKGTALGIAHTFGQSLWWRPNNKHPEISGLYYTGQYTNPGVGVPMALVSAQMVTEMIGSRKVDTDQIFKKGSTTYYYSSLFFQGQAKKDVFSLYAYVRIVDDFVDTQTPALLELETMWKETEKAWRGEISQDAVVQNFIELAKRKKFKLRWIVAFWAAMRSDLKKKNYSNYEELEQYMYGSAEVIGLMMAKILDLPPAATKAAALQGKAMQFVNFIRDVKEDEELGRNYLGYSRAHKADKKKWERFIRTQIKRYWELQQQAAKGYQYIPKKYLIPIKTAAEMYSWTARHIYKNPHIVWQKKVKPSKRRVVLQLLKNSLV